jgi:uncharacterized Ntn-hydrolase superfamily protein
MSFFVQPPESNLNTFSVVLKCPITGNLGAASASKFLAVGAVVWAAHENLGIALSQAFVNPLAKRRILDAVSLGKSPQEALDFASSLDPYPQLRQLAFLGFDGRMAAHTGANTDTVAGHQLISHGIVIGNMLANERVLPEMALAAYAGFEEGLPLAEVLLKVLMAAEAAGGDKRGKESSTLVVIRKGLSHPLIDLRVDHNVAPIPELCRLYGVYNDHYRGAIENFPNEWCPGGKRGLNLLTSNNDKDK